MHKGVHSHSCMCAKGGALALTCEWVGDALMRMYKGAVGGQECVQEGGRSQATDQHRDMDRGLGTPGLGDVSATLLFLGILSC